MAPPSCSPSAKDPGPIYIQKLQLPSTLDTLQPLMFTVEDHSPVHLLATDEGRERVIIETLIKELNEKFNVGLDSNFSTSRSVLPDSHEDQLLPGEIIVIGSSHASRIATALSSQGEQVKCLP